MTPAGTVIVLAGEADVLSSGLLVEALMQQLAPGVVKLIVDVSKLAYMDSMALRAVVMAARVLRNRGGKLILLRPRAALRRMLTITGADTFMLVQP
jgi:anti-sigma B factor antagonist